MKRLFLVLTLLPSLVMADVVIKSGATTDTMNVNTNKAAETTQGKSSRATYNVSFSALTAATAHTVSIESPSGNTLRLVRWCVGTSNATAASSIAVILQRRTTASSAGTLAVAEGTGASVVTKLDPGDGNFSGIARLDGTPGTAGAVIDQQQIQVGIIATGAGSSLPYCMEYGTRGDKPPIVSAGVANGISLTVPSFGAGSLATSITAQVMVE